MKFLFFLFLRIEYFLFRIKKKKKPLQLYLQDHLVQHVKSQLVPIE